MDRVEVSDLLASTNDMLTRLDRKNQVASSTDFVRVDVLLKDDSGQTVGGLWGRTSFGWLFVELLFVPEVLRGRRYGVRLLETAENAAIARNCHAVWLDTYDFQAAPFYERLGYREFGRLEDYPREHTRRFLHKDL